MIKHTALALFLLISALLTACADDAAEPDFGSIPIAVPTAGDKNANHMLDKFETVADQGRDCAKYTDCVDFCDSFIGYKCSTRCTSDDQCVSDEFFCRADGRCAPKVFETLWEIQENDMEIGFCPQMADDCDFTVDWGDGSAPESYKCPMTTSVRHTYAEPGYKRVRMTGQYDGFTASRLMPNGYYHSCSASSFRGIISFGPVGIGPKDSSFLFSRSLRTDVISAIDIPDATKLVSIAWMFNGGMVFSDKDNPSQTTPAVPFNLPIGNWDVSNVTDMHGAFSENDQFNQDITRWDVSRVTDTERMFYKAANFNQDLSQWDIASNKTASTMFYHTSLTRENYCKLLRDPRWQSLNKSALTGLGLEYECPK